MPDIWTNPVDRVLRELISPAIWNADLAANLRLLSLHTHSGVAGDGAQIAGTVLYSGPMSFFVSPFDQVGATLIVSVANEIRWSRFYLPFKLSLGSLTCEVTTLHAGSTLGLGIYNKDGTALLASGTSSSATTGVKRITVTPIVLDPDFYLLAQTNTGAVAQARIIHGTGNALSIFSNTNPQTGTASAVSAAGVLPASLGVLTGANSAPVLTKLEGS